MNVAEIAGLQAVAVDAWGFAAAERGDEGGDDGGVLAVGALARAEDVEVAEAQGGHAVDVGVDAGVILAGEFGGGVGALGGGEHGFDFGKHGRVAVGAAAGGVDEAADAGLAGGFEEGQGAGGVHVVVVEG